jgi:hypothetical protein
LAPAKQSGEKSPLRGKSTALLSLHTFILLKTTTILAEAPDGMLEDWNIDDLVKSQKSRHSCESRSPELLELTGFPLSRE